jgi:hypothetical protein
MSETAMPCQLLFLFFLFFFLLLLHTSPPVLCRCGTADVELQMWNLTRAPSSFTMLPSR